MRDIDALRAHFEAVVAGPQRRAVTEGAMVMVNGLQLLLQRRLGGRGDRASRRARLLTEYVNCVLALAGDELTRSGTVSERRDLCRTLRARLLREFPRVVELGIFDDFDLAIRSCRIGVRDQVLEQLHTRGCGWIQRRAAAAYVDATLALVNEEISIGNHMEVTS